MNRTAVLTFVSALIGFAATGEPLVRNPFWPQGYSGRRHRIDITPRYPSAVASPEVNVSDGDQSATVEPGQNQGAKTVVKSDSYTPQDAENALWMEAGATLRFSDPCTFVQDDVSRQCLRINGRLYESGDLISINHGPRRFTWTFLGFGTNESVRLSRVRQRELSEQERNANQPF